MSARQKNDRSKRLAQAFCLLIAAVAVAYVLAALYIQTYHPFH